MTTSANDSVPCRTFNGSSSNDLYVGRSSTLTWTLERAKTQMPPWLVAKLAAFAAHIGRARSKTRQPGGVAAMTFVDSAVSCQVSTTAKKSSELSTIVSSTTAQLVAERACIEDAYRQWSHDERVKQLNRDEDTLISFSSRWQTMRRTTTVHFANATQWTIRVVLTCW